MITNFFMNLPLKRKNTKRVLELQKSNAPSPQDQNARMLVAGIQMSVPITGGNVGRMCAEVGKAMALFPGVEMIVFSELAAHGPLLTSMVEDPAADEQKFQELAARHKIWLLPGSMFVKRESKIFNHSIVIDPTGRIIGRYDKLFPFQPFEKGVEGGSHLFAFDVPGVGRFGIAICYDIWFPEVMRALSSDGVEVLLHPVLTGTTDRSAELSIAKATSAMFQCYVVDVNGLDAGGIGKSLVTDPTGRAVYQAGQTPEIFPIMLDLGLVRQCRQSGANGLGQVLKSWRDRSISLPGEDRNQGSSYLQSLGPLHAAPHGR